MQRLLLDTHALVWWLSDVSELAEDARGHIADPRNDVFVGAITDVRLPSSARRERSPPRATWRLWLRKGGLSICR